MSTKILFIGDITGKVGRKMAIEHVPLLKEKYDVDFCIINGENSAGGFGINIQNADDLFQCGADVITTGNHVWDRKETKELMLTEPRLLRPANYPELNPGNGLFASSGSTPTIIVINLMGRVFMPSVDCPFRKIDKLLKNLEEEECIIFIDFHGETTSEKIAMGWHLDGRVSAIVGTHTHVQTADNRVLPKGTAYITDVGMTGPLDSVIGMDTSIALEKFLMGIPKRLEPAKGIGQLNGVLIHVNSKTRQAESIERISLVQDTK
ncbi:MAG: TIGR00282 family metallophosphoesterase [Nitrospinota bacterium]|nr:TIGR00282 family metallophosphoesterase [Nitrospinota bacterium]